MHISGDVGGVGIAVDVAGRALEDPEEVSRKAPAPRAHVIPQYMCPGEGGRKSQKAHRVVDMVDDGAEWLCGVAEGGGTGDVVWGIGGVTGNSVCRDW
jgi:hypothetical protein